MRLPLAVDIESVPAPAREIYRIARSPGEPFALPDWTRAGNDGTFGNRFDDPGGTVGIPVGDRFRVIYCATQREAAFAEVIARFRQRPHLAQALSQIEDGEESIVESLGGAVDPAFPDYGLLESGWLQRRRIGTTRIVTEGKFAVIDHANSLVALEQELVPLLHWFGIDQLDLSSITSATPRILTQFAARHLYQRGFAGIRYTSRLGSNWECWALFEKCFQHEVGYPGFPENISPDDVDLLNAAKRFGLTIELFRGHGHYMRPWQQQD